MLIRTMRPADIEEVTRIEQASFSQPWTEDGFRVALESSDALLTVAEEGQKVVGYICMYQSFEEGEITNVAVDQAYRGRHIGKALLKKTVQMAKGRGVTRIILEVRVSNAPAICLYEEAGFQKLGIRKAFYDFPKEDAWMMDLKINHVV